MMPDPPMPAVPAARPSWYPTVYNPATSHFQQDPIMRSIIERVGPYHLRIEPDAWSALFQSVVYQQVSGKSAASAVDRVRLQFGGIPTAHAIRHISSGRLAACGMTKRKESTIRTLATDVARGAIDLASFPTKHDSFIRSTLTHYTGVGPWTADMFLVFHLARPDVFMSGDLGLRKAIQKEYHLVHATSPLPSPEACALLADQKWRPHRTIASWYLWKSDPTFPEPGFAPPPKVVA